LASTTIAPVQPRIAASAVGERATHGWTARTRLMAHRPAFSAVIFLALIHFGVLFGPLVLTVSPEEVSPINTFAPPSAAHWLGTDESGRDVLARLLQGGRVSLGVGLAAVLIAVTLGSLIGAVSGYFRGIADGVLMRLTDAVMALPTFFLLLVVLALFGGGVIILTVVIGLTSWMGVARLVRSEFIRWRSREFVEAAICTGADHRRIIVRHLLPQAIPSLIVALTLGVAAAILTEAAMSYLGLGIAPPMASWGNLLTNSQRYIYQAPQLAVFPGALILATVLAYGFLGDGLREVLDPEARHDSPLKKEK
jgi:peptide/nickel transport system permease protein